MNGMCSTSPALRRGASQNSTQQRRVNGDCEAACGEAYVGIAGLQVRSKRRGCCCTGVRGSCSVCRDECWSSCDRFFPSVLADEKPTRWWSAVWRAAELKVTGGFVQRHWTQRSSIRGAFRAMCGDRLELAAHLWNQGLATEGARLRTFVFAAGGEKDRNDAQSRGRS